MLFFENHGASARRRAINACIAEKADLLQEQYELRAICTELHEEGERQKENAVLADSQAQSANRVMAEDRRALAAMIRQRNALKETVWQQNTELEMLRNVVQHLGDEATRRRSEAAITIEGLHRSEMRISELEEQAGELLARPALFLNIVVPQEAIKEERLLKANSAMLDTLRQRDEEIHSLTRQLEQADKEACMIGIDPKGQLYNLSNRPLVIRPVSEVGKA